MKSPALLVIIAAFALHVSGCGFRKDKPQPQTDGSTNDDSIEASTLSYSTVHQNIFAQNCISCHGTAGGVNLESYASIKANLGKIERAVLIDKTMPKGRSLGRAEMRLLRAWIRAGAPEHLPGEPQVPDEPLRPNFVSIKKKVLGIRCMSCHSAGEQAAGVPLDTLNDLVNSPRELVLPGKPDESGLLIALTRQDAKRMPPPEVSNPLSQDEIGVIRRWIEIGAPLSKDEIETFRAWVKESAKE